MRSESPPLDTGILSVSSQEEGHLSYACPKNSMGARKPPVKKKKKKGTPCTSSMPSRDTYHSDDDLPPIIPSQVISLQASIFPSSSTSHRSRSFVRSLSRARLSRAPDAMRVSSLLSLSPTASEKCGTRAENRIANILINQPFARTLIDRCAAHAHEI